MVIPEYQITEIQILETSISFGFFHHFALQEFLKGILKNDMKQLMFEGEQFQERSFRTG